MFNISFLNSGIIIFTLSALLPILIYLFAKKKPKKIIFSSLKFIKATTQQNHRKINLKNILLLIIRILIILFTILAIARPALKYDFLQSSDAHPKTAIAIIIDNSYSMDYLIDSKTALEHAKQKIKIINEKISENDLSIILTCDSEWNDLMGNVHYGKLDNSFYEISITPNSIPLNEVLKIAEKKLADLDLLNREVIIISDLQATKLPTKTNITTFYIPVHENESLPNISIQKSAFSHNLVDRKSENKITFSVINHSNSAQENIICRLFIDGVSSAEKVVNLKAKQEKKLEFKLHLQESGWHDGFVEVVNERLTFDNKNYFAFFHNQNPKLAFFSKLDKLPKPLESIAKIYNKDYKIISDLNLNDLSNFDVIAVYQPPQLNSKNKFILDKLSKERGIIFFADAHLSDEWKNYFSEKFDSDFISYHDKIDENATISSSQKHHIITRDIRLDKAITINDFWEIKTKSNILMGSDNSALIIEKDKSILYLFDPASMINKFLVSPAFPVITYNSFVFSQKDNNYTSLTTGSRVNFSEDFITPSGKISSVKNMIVHSPGIYKSESKVLAVNIPYEESNFIKLDYKGDIKILNPQNWENKIISSRYGFEIWKILLILVILLFISEMLIIKISERRAS
jgi:hypothetical protein